jgi:hypothetical protein
MRRFPIVLLGVVSVLISAGGASGSVPSPAAVTVDDAKPALNPDGGGWKVTVGLTNVTDQPLTLRLGAVQPAAGGTCLVMFAGSPVLPPAAHEDVDVTYSPGCAVDNRGVAFTVTHDGEPAQGPIGITATAKKQTKIEWGVLWWFVYGTLGALVLLGLAGLLLKGVDRIRPWTTLDHLPATWSFSDSWVSNITVLGGALTSVVGSSGTVKAILGDDADTAIARATIGAAIAAVLIGLGAVVLQVLKSKGTFTVGGLIAAGAVTVGAALGELYIVWKTAEMVSLDGLQSHLDLPFYVVSGLLAVYAMRNLRETIRAGVKAPDTAVVVPDTAIIAAALLSELEQGHSDPQILIGAVKQQLEAAAAAKHAATGAVVVPVAAVQPGSTMMMTVRRRPMHAAML